MKALLLSWKSQATRFGAGSFFLQEKCWPQVGKVLEGPDLNANIHVFINPVTRDDPVCSPSQNSGCSGCTLLFCGSYNTVCVCLF